jgi:capsule polysaccharide export protein KpsE/RkpR
MKPLNNFKAPSFVVLMNVKGIKTIDSVIKALLLTAPLLYRLREQIKLQSSELIEHQKFTKGIQIHFTDLQSQTIPKEFEINKLKHENEYLNKELAFYQSQLSSKENAERILRKENNEKISTLENEIQSLKHQLEEKNSKFQLVNVRNFSKHFH